MEPPGAARAVRVDGGGSAAAAGRAGGRQGRPGPQGAGLLRAAGALGGWGGRLAGAGLAALRRRPPGQRAHDPVSRLVLRQAGGGGQDGAAAGLGQRRLARQQGSPRLDPAAQPPGQAHRRRGADRELLPAGQEPLAQPHRAQVGAQQAPRGRAGAAAAGRRVDRARLRRLRLPARTSPQRVPTCGLILH